MKHIGSLFYKPKRKDKEIAAKRWNFPSIIWRAVVKACTVIGAMILISAVLSTLLIIVGSKAGTPLPDDMVLVFKLENGIAELPKRPSLLDPFPFMQPTLRNVIDTIDKAKDDDRVRGIVFSVKGGGVSIAQIQELRTAIEKFKESGKFTKIYSPSYVDGNAGLGIYYLASAFDEIWMQPVGMLSVSGLNMEMPFARTALDKIGVRPQFFQREDYKSAMENFTNSNMSDESRKSLEDLIGNLSARMMEGVVNGRGLDYVTVGQMIDKGLLTGKEALDAKLIDRLDYGDVMVSEIRQSAKGNPDDQSVKLITLARYSQDKVKPPKTAAKHKSVALIYAVGAIVPTAGAQGNAGADKISAAITEAYEDDDIGAIVLRVDSPGGSPSASETIRRALVKAKEKNKKVIVSMGSVAASGGYWIAADADRIFASGGTITGSIGVVMGKFEASELWKKIGVNWEGPKMGRNSDIWSINQPFDELETERMNTLIDYTYDAFLQRVAEGRGMTVGEVRKVAQGRAWTGEDAQLNGLVDELGGLNNALDYAATTLGGQTRKDVRIIRMPRELNRVEQLLEIFGQEQVSIGKFFGFDNAAMKKISAVISQIGLVQDNGTTVYDAELESFR